MRTQRKATDVLYDKMMFYHTKAEKITKYLIELIERHHQSRGDLLAQLHKELHRYNSIVIDCASKLAPYQSPKLETIEINNKSTIRHVIMAPRPVATTDEWLKLTKIEQNTRVIDITPNNNNESIN